jgi:hypothetical protein
MLAHQREPAGAVVESLLLIWADSEDDEWRDRVVFLPL